VIVTAPCSREFFPAVHDSGTVSLTDKFWIVQHDEEASTARSAAEWFRNPRSGGSTQLTVDDAECYRCLPNEAVPWGAASAFGANEHGIHIEWAGFAAWKAWQWAKHLRTLNRAAYKTAVALKATGNPVYFVSAFELPHKRGVTTHREISKASRRLDPAHAWQYSHSDLGPFWPRRLFMRRVAFYRSRLP
jgi:N-acetylmuramoyl-L-alanine amidase